ncbi:host cell division inhibitor Icd-like protein [Pantoea anthophila]|uniref:host cell division inhibitor Icd-like protein n=1 Tax=Pantoea anthophila TaxID=470931 RepID=UPI002549E475|nr:host cell division inhibitor Icd-like protein [Pantoea anthophila]WIM56933.1 host cell division inhibitor Icd-like protein [Pantoea anthophila]
MPLSSFTPGLRAGGFPWYIIFAVAKSAAGIGVLNITLATPDAPCVFFCVCALMHPFIGRRFCIRRAVCVMVAQAGASHEAPVSNVAGYANPVWATTSEIGVSGGSCSLLTLETALMATVLISPYPQFVFVFAAVRRHQSNSRIQMLRATANNERAARQILARDYVLSFACRLPVAEVRA